MAIVEFELKHTFEAPAQVVWDELVDWVGHEAWIPATKVEVHGDGDPTAVGAEFTAWTGLALTTALGRRLSLEDRMRVDELMFDKQAACGRCRVEKIGPMLTGSASFTVTQDPAPSEGHTTASPRTEMRWVEAVKVPYAPQFLAPVLARVGAAGFRFGMVRLAKLIKNDRRA